MWTLPVLILVFATFLYGLDWIMSQIASGER